MDLLFPGQRRRAEPDPDFAAEVDAARDAGFVCRFFDFDALRAGEPYRLPEGSGPLLYRGWMCRDTEYAALHARLVDAGWTPVTTPAAYDEAHYLPLAYRHIVDETPRTRWIEGADEDAAWTLYDAEFRRGDALIKDWVKSAKYRWREACFLPAGTDRTRFAEVFAAFLTERSTLFEKGVVLREFHPFRELRTDMRGLPIHEEYRLFFWDGQPLVLPDVLLPPGPEAEMARWQSIARRFVSRFLSLDVARDEGGAWKIVETGDGGVAGIPGSIAPHAFYRALRAAG